MTDATALAAAIAEGRIAARDAMAESLARLREIPGAVVRQLSEKDAFEAADEARSGVFGGLPFLGKDLGSAARGLGISAGNPTLRGLIGGPEQDSALFARFRAAGLVTFGLTTVPEFGLALTSSPRGMPPALNPFDVRYSAGGSSGGAALAVATGIVALAHATDAAGSIRVPAACCGLWGLKPSRGAIPVGPDFGNHLMGITSELVLARSLRDITASFNAVRVSPQPSVQNPDPPTMRIALWTPPNCYTVNQKALEASAKRLAAVGYRVEPQPWPAAWEQHSNYLIRLVLSVALAEWTSALSLTGNMLTPITDAIAREGRGLSGEAVFAACRDIEQLTHEVNGLFDTYDAVLMPVLSGLPPDANAFPDAETEPEDRFARMAELAPLASLANVAGLASLAFPAGFENGLPVGAQLMGRMGHDAKLLTLAAPLANYTQIPFPAPIAGLPE